MATFAGPIKTTSSALNRKLNFKRLISRLPGNAIESEALRDLAAAYLISLNPLVVISTEPSLWPKGSQSVCAE